MVLLTSKAAAGTLELCELRGDDVLGEVGVLPWDIVISIARFRSTALELILRL
jgi:hypothetical protein